MPTFGTDGVRGLANVELTPEYALVLGRAAARVLGRECWAIGRDTRRSGPMIEAAFAAGLASEGADVVSLGVSPTPEVAWWSTTEKAPAAVISASHNPFPDNGIKIFSAGGRKLPDEAQARVESEIRKLGISAAAAAVGAATGQDPPTGQGVGNIVSFSAHAGYGAAVAASIEGRRLDGLRVVVDCANGSASVVAPDVLRALGAEVDVLHGTPDGVNINDRCGSTHPSDLQLAVHEHRAEVGVAFDGDADRVLFVDGHSRVVDGDQTMAICAIDLAARELLPDDTVVVTVMTNLGFRLAMAERGINVIDTKVGDRYVLEALEAGGYALGGEQSGHVIFRDLATTGDGLLTAVQLLDVVVRSGRSLGMLADEAMTRLPQVLKNVRISGATPASELAERLARDIAHVEDDLGERGRVLVRPSGTEPLVRVMVEAPTEVQAEAAASRLVSALEALGG
ncbi:MAG TPA: phosphoglucosamine mutase [Acidimicrobiales bacterium]|nr:phosphoglucosamine mutase [Acidimicrobiales bacterium]